MSNELIALLSMGASFLLVATSLLNFTVFMRQLKATREQLDMARRQLAFAQTQPEIQLIQRAMAETSDHVKIFVERPYLRPYFYDNRRWVDGDRIDENELKAMAELLLNVFASALIHSATFPQYPIRGVEQTIRYHLRNSPVTREYLVENFDRFPLSGLALLCLRHETRQDIESDIQRLVVAAGSDRRERERREQLLYLLRRSPSSDTYELAHHSLERVRMLAGATPR